MEIWGRIQTTKTRQLRNGRSGEEANFDILGLEFELELELELIFRIHHELTSSSWVSIAETIIVNVGSWRLREREREIC